jgi:branched-chain amino acid transport system substrate-binding protein
MKIIALLLLMIILIAGCVQQSELSKESIKIGAIIPLTGPAASQRIYASQTAQMVEEDINAAGGISGRPVKIVVEDSQSSPSQGVTAFQKLVFEGSVAIFSMLSSVSVPLSYEADKAKIPLIMSLVTAKNATRGNTWAFRHYITADRDAAAMAAYLYSIGKIKAGIIAINDEYGASSSQEFTDAFAGEIAATEKFDSTSMDFRTQLTKIKDTNPDAVYLIGFDIHIINIVKQAKELRLNTTLATTTLLTTPATQKEVAPFVDVIYGTAGEYNLPNNTKATEFKQRYTEKFGQEPSAYAAYFYDSFMMFKKAIENSDDPESMRQSLENMEYDGLLGKIRFLPSHDTDLQVYVFKLENGQFLPAE